MNYYPLFRVRSWNNGVRCTSFYMFLILRIVAICSVCCGDLHKLPIWRLGRRCSLVTLGCAPQGNRTSGEHWGKPPTQNPKFVDSRSIFIIEISYPNNFITKLFCKLHSRFKDIFWFSQWYCGSSYLWQDIATDRVKPETNPTPFEVSRQDKPPSKHCKGHCCWSIRVL